MSKCRKKSNEELYEQLTIQLQLIADYIQSITAGKLYFYLPLATSLRILFFDNNFPNKQSVMEYLIKKYKINAFCFSPQGLDETGIDTQPVLTFVGSYIWLKHDPEMRFYKLRSLSEWKDIKMANIGSNTFSPRDILSFYYNKMGGAHIDPNQSYTHDSLLSIEYQGNVEIKNEVHKIIKNLTPIIIFYLKKVLKYLQDEIRKEKELSELFNKRKGNPNFKNVLKYLIAKKDFDNARNLIKDKIDKYINDEIIIKITFVVGQYEKNYEYAYNLLKNFAQNNHAHIGVQKELGDLLLLVLKKYDEAEYYYNQVLESEPDNIAVRTNLGIIFFLHFSKYEKAAKHFRFCIDLSPENSEYHYNYASLKKAMGNKDEALEHFLLAIELEPFTPKFHNDIGWLYEKEFNDFDSALYHYWIAFSVDSSFSIAFNNYKNLKEKMNI